MDDKFVYFPHRSSKWLVQLSAPIGMLAFVGVGCCLLAFVWVGIMILAGIGALSWWLTKVLYDSSRTTLLFDQTGVHIVGGYRNNYRYLPWKELQYATYTRNSKGHLFLVLSNVAISHQEAKRFANRGQTSIDSVIVIHMDEFQNLSYLKEFVSKYTLYLDT